MGFFPDLFAEKPELLADPTGKKWSDMVKAGKGNDAAFDIIDKFSRGDISRGADVSTRVRPPTPQLGS